MIRRCVFFLRNPKKIHREEWPNLEKFLIIILSDLGGLGGPFHELLVPAVHWHVLTDDDGPVQVQGRWSCFVDEISIDANRYLSQKKYIYIYTSILFYVYIYIYMSLNIGIYNATTSCRYMQNILGDNVYVHVLSSPNEHKARGV